MNYFTAVATSPVYEFPYSSYQTNSISNFDNDINAILANLTPSIGAQIYNQPPTLTLQCVPQINTGIGDGTIVYHVPENMPVDMLLQQLGINTNTLQSSNTMCNYYRTGICEPIELVFPPPPPQRRRRLVCREVSDSEDDGYLRRPSRQHHFDSWSDQPQQSPVALHNVLGKVWQKAERGSRNLPSSFSAPDLNSQWRNRNPSPPNASTSNVWQAMRNASPPMPPDNRNAVNNAWQRADYASEQRSNRLANVFNRMQQPTGNIMQPPPPPPQPPPLQNREAVQDFFAARNLPYGINAIPPNREAVQDFNAVRNLPYGINAMPPNQEAVQHFNAVRNLPYGMNTGPPLSSPAINNFFAARNVPYGINQPNPAVANVWNRADYAVQQGPPMINVPWNQGPPPSPPPNMWNRMPPGSSYPGSPMGFPQRGPSNLPAPMSFASILSQAHRQHLPYAGGT